MKFSFKAISTKQILVVLTIALFSSSHALADANSSVSGVAKSVNKASNQITDAIAQPAKELNGATNAINKANNDVTHVNNQITNTNTEITNQVDTLNNTVTGTATAIDKGVESLGESAEALGTSVKTIGGAVTNTGKSVFGFFSGFTKKKGYQYKHKNGSENCIVLMSDAGNVSQMRLNIKGNNKVRDIKRAFNKCSDNYKEAKVKVRKFNRNDGSWNGSSYKGRTTGAEIINREVVDDGVVEYQFVVTFPDNVTEKQSNVHTKILEAKRVAVILLGQLGKNRDSKLVLSSL